MTTDRLLRTWAVAAVLCAAPPVAIAQDDERYEIPLPEGVLGQTTFFVEEFVPNRVKVDAQAPDRRYGDNDPLRIMVSAEEMFGQPISNRPVSGSVSWSPQPFDPEDWPGFTFGDNERKFDPSEVGLPEAYLAADGKTSITIQPPKKLPPAALKATVQVTVKDGGRGVTRKIARTVDPLPFYLGIKKSGETYPRPGEEAQFQVAAVKPDGVIAVADAVLSGTVYRIKWHSNLERHGASYSFNTHRELIAEDAVGLTLADGRGAFTWTPPSVGNYLVKLADPATSASVSDTFYVSDSDWSHQPWSLEEPEAVDLVLDKDSYSAGETARLIIKSPFPGTVLLTLEQDRVLTSTVLAMTENTLEVPIALTEEMLPNVYAVASVIRPVQPAQQWLPHRAIGMINLPVTTGSRVLDVTLTVPDEVRPNGDMQVTAMVRDMMTSAPVSGDIILWAVDEGVLTLTDFETPAPGEFFAASRHLMVDTADFFSKLMPDLISAAQAASPTGGGDMEGRKHLSPVSTERVKPVILWQGPARTDADGRLQVQWKVPQFMGRLRVMAMAADGKRFGNGDATTFVRNPVMINEYLPRFVAPGDQFQAGFTVYNNSDATITPTVNINSGELLSAEGQASETLSAIAPRSQATIYRAMTAAPESFGQATVTFEAVAGAENFNSSVTLPVRPASPRIRESASIAVPAGENAELRMPGGDFLPDTTTATLVVGGMPTLDLAAALTYNIEYPYVCSEQIISRLFPLIYLGDLARATEPGRFSDEGIRVTVQSGIDRVLMSQTASGGLSMWVGNREPWPWISVYGAHFLVEAERAGYQVNPDYKLALLDYLSEEIAAAGRSETEGADGLTEQAYANYVLARAGRKMQQNLGALHGSLDKMTEEARALFAAAYMESGMNQEARAILGDTPIPTDNVTSATRHSGGILSSPVRETAILLITWLDVDAGAAQVADLVRRLIDLRKGDEQWGTTQDNSFALMALGRYAQKVAGAEPVAGTVLVGGESRQFTTSEPLTLSMAELAGADISIQCDRGKAYAWYSVEGVPISPPESAVQNGIGLTRRYIDREGEPLDPADLQQGQLVVVELQISGKRALENVVLQDLLPAGLEIENPRLASSAYVGEASEIDGISVNRTDIRDDRILIFGNLHKPHGEFQLYRYTARAVSPGEYAQPPAMLDVMYDPSISARTKPGRVTIAPRD